VLLAAGGGLYWLLRPLPIVEPTRIDTRPTTEGEGPSGPGPVETAPSLGQLVQAGRLDEAFALTREAVGAGRPLPDADVWLLAEGLQRAGRLDESFALMRELANKGHGPSAFALAEMYDPLHWSKERSPFSKPNARKARDWYGRAGEAGVAEAQSRIRALDAQGEER
jgi:TPR repeat protein